MEQHPQIVAIHAKLPADFVAVAFIEKHSLEQGPVAGIEFQQNRADFVLDLPGSHDFQRVGALVGQLGPALHIERLAAAGSAVLLKEHSVADCIHKGAQALGLAQPAVLAQNREDAGKGLLTHILDRLWRLKPRAELQLEQPRKIGNEVLLRPVVTSTEVINVTCIE